MLDKERRSNFFALLCQAVIFFMVYYAIHYVYPYFYPYYAQGALTVELESSRTILGCACLVFLWFALLKQQKLYKLRNNISSATMVLSNYLYFLPGSFMNILYSCDYEYVVIYTLFCVLLNIVTITLSKKKTANRTQFVFKISSREINNDYICYALTVVLLFASLCFIVSRLS